jgi:hypothetical protein
LNSSREKIKQLTCKILEQLDHQRNLFFGQFVLDVDQPTVEVQVTGQLCASRYKSSDTVFVLCRGRKHNFIAVETLTSLLKKTLLNVGYEKETPKSSTENLILDIFLVNTLFTEANSEAISQYT